MKKMWGIPCVARKKENIWFISYEEQEMKEGYILALRMIRINSSCTFA
jgi:hypothetical protein